jgi:hypothetical protein
MTNSQLAILIYQSVLGLVPAPQAPHRWNAGLFPDFPQQGNEVNEESGRLSLGSGNCA